MDNIPLYPPSKVIRLLSNMRSTSNVETSEEDLAGFLAAQKLAYRCVQTLILKTPPKRNEINS